MQKIISIPEGITVLIDNNILTVQGSLGNTKKELKSPIASVKLDGKNIIIESVNEKRRGKSIINTFESHINNLFTGVTKGYEAKMKLCYSHYPATMKVDGEKLIIENFVGEKKPRYAKILPDCKVKVNGAEVTITGNNKESVGQTAANIETATKIKKKDLRCFQDGIWITKKPGKEGL